MRPHHVHANGTKKNDRAREEKDFHLFRVRIPFRDNVHSKVKKKKKKKKKKERKKEEENEKHFASRICFYFQHQAAPFLYDSANNVSTDEIERLSISLKNNLCLSLPRIQILKIDRARYIRIHLYGNTGLARYRLPTLCIRNKYMCAREQGSPPT